MLTDDQIDNISGVFERHGVELPFNNNEECDRFFKIFYLKMTEIIKKEPKECSARSGSGYYDSNGSPPCGACNGTGLEE